MYTHDKAVVPWLCECAMDGAGQLVAAVASRAAGLLLEVHNYRSMACVHANLSQNGA